ncbi:TonB-dependent receptor [Algibacter mikhailovii]|uniref:TonB-dependent receptor n=1 Tax=Algibacter mikhailovii TaxID=425498 RepID=UPI0024947CE3|nr:Plug domain-containing protein [Algibacter mikhailovii]
MVKKVILSFTIVLFLSFTIISNFKELVLSKLLNYTDNYPEKIYVHTDKPYYTIGDDIWFTAYLLNGITHRNTEKSRIIYVELIDSNNNIIDKKQLYTSEISVSGDFKIEKNWRSGNYLLRAYTNYMINQDPDYFFQSEIFIWNLKETDATWNHTDDKNNDTSSTSFLTSKPEIKFYPEGGNLIAGIFCKVAIQVKDKNNRNIAIQGSIKDDDNKEICFFKTADFGLGQININPVQGKTYYASVFINNEEIKYPLPKALPSGHNLSIINHGNQIIIKVSSNSPIGLKNTFLLGHQRGQVIFEKFAPENQSEYLVKLNTDIIPDGVSNFTLFDNNGKPVSERLVFIDNPNNEVTVNTSLNKSSLTTREKVTMTIDLKDNNDLPLKGILSMAITDIDAIEHSSTAENIKTYLLLNSDLRGSIENPGYFFEKNDDVKRRYLLDLIMLTHGWRRFKWTDLLYGNTINANYAPEKGIFISGHTNALKGDKQRISAATRITLMDKFPYQKEEQSDQNGNFKFGPYVFADSLPIILEARVKDFKSDDDEKNRFVSIFLNESVNKSPDVKKDIVLKSFLEDSIKINNFLNQSKKISILDSLFIENTTRLDQIVIKARKKTEEELRNQELNSRTTYGSPSNRIDMSDLENQRSRSIIDLLNMLPGVTAFNNTVSIRNQGTPNIIIDGMPGNLDDILFMTGEDVDFIDVLKGANANMFSNAANGVIVIHTRTGSFDKNMNVKRKPGIINFNAKGFYTAREFYTPDHDKAFEDITRQDIRTTLHWEPRVILSEESNKASISFYTSDKKSNYGIKIEGITNTGIPFCHLSTFEVN